MVARNPLRYSLGICAALGCGGAGSSVSSPDRNDVAAAQAEWCKELGKLKGGDWDQMGACKVAFPTSSGPYLRRMTKCFFGRLASLGKDAPDNSQLVSDCNEEATEKVDADDQGSQEIIAARCSRMEKCEKIAVGECKSAFLNLDKSQRVMFTTIYNKAAQHEIADCLSSKSCSEDEEAARGACYKAAGDRLLWFGD